MPSYAVKKEKVQNDHIAPNVKTSKEIFFSYSAKLNLNSDKHGINRTFVEWN